MPAYTFTAVAVLALIAIGIIVLLLRGRSDLSALQAEFPGTTSDDIRRAIVELLETTAPGDRGGFVIFGGDRDLDYVQYSLEPNGLLLNWPTIQEGGRERLSAFRRTLESRGFRGLLMHPDSAVSDEIANMQTGHFIVVEDGLYAQVGRDPVVVRDLTLELLQSAFGIDDVRRVHVTLELQG